MAYQGRLEQQQQCKREQRPLPLRLKTHGEPRANKNKENTTTTPKNGSNIVQIITDENQQQNTRTNTGEANEPVRVSETWSPTGQNENKDDKKQKKKVAGTSDCPTYLHGAGHDFRRASRPAIGEDHKRSRCRPDGSLRRAVRHVLEVAPFDGHDAAPLGHKQGRNVHGGLQQATCFC